MQFLLHSGVVSGTLTLIRTSTDNAVLSPLWVVVADSHFDGVSVEPTLD
jgi:hypothetical protein